VLLSELKRSTGKWHSDTPSLYLQNFEWYMPIILNGGWFPTTSPALTEYRADYARARAWVWFKVRLKEIDKTSWILILFIPEPVKLQSGNVTFIQLYQPQLSSPYMRAIPAPQEQDQIPTSDQQLLWLRVHQCPCTRSRDIPRYPSAWMWTKTQLRG